MGHGYRSSSHACAYLDGTPAISPAPAIMIAKVHRVRIASLPPLEVDAAYLRPSQWRHIDLNRALFAQSGGGRVDGSNDTEISPNDRSRRKTWPTNPAP